MAAPNVALLSAVVIAAGARQPALFERVKDYVWYSYHNTDGLDLIPQPNHATDVGGAGAAIYVAFVAAGITALTGGVAYWLEQIGNTVLTYPYTRSATGVLDWPTS